jgi:hypothetical protein
MLVTDDDKQFVSTGFKKVTGWCTDEAAYMTCCLLRKQALAGHGGGSFEIGVYQGKYLSLLYHRARIDGQPVVGVDTFQWSSAKGVLETLGDIFGTTDHLRLITANSKDLTAAQIREALGGQLPAFISVDGDHGAPAVTRDLVFAGKILAKGGIIALDDFLNPRAIGVSEGAYRCFLQPNWQLRPFCYTSNKLFLSHPDFHSIYRGAIAEFVRERPELPIVQEFQRWRDMGQNYVEQELLGSNILIF